MEYSTALRPFIIKRLEQVKKADILVGIPCFNNEATIANVMTMVSDGLFTYYKDLRPVIFVSDGGSTDDTRDIAQSIELKPWQERIIQIYRGVAGKGSAFRAIFEAARILDVDACMVVDSDLRSISPQWVQRLLSPVLEKKYQFVAPVYTRYKYDGTITNNIVYNIIRAVFGKRIRQPIGGDFTFSKRLAQLYLDKPVWSTDIARFGIDIFMTVNAIVSHVEVCQANLGVKIHDAKDPAQSLGPMFVQVIGTLFRLMEHYEPYWKNIEGSKPVPTFGDIDMIEPEAIEVNLQRLVDEFKTGFIQFNALYREMFSNQVFTSLKDSAHMDVESFKMPVEIWVKIVYELAAIYHTWQINKVRLINLMVPLYFGRIASFINETISMNSFEAEEVVEQQAQVFEHYKPYLMEKWQATGKNIEL
ncbi:MAG TPA: glycosyltransferase [Spirochaetota bacterium]|nr:glycosyltransferase [Spirochaetota bacterium]HPP49579.1 glycosyltransferase [Spirochaetota bacterium]